MVYGGVREVVLEDVHGGKLECVPNGVHGGVPDSGVHGGVLDGVHIGWCTPWCSGGCRW